MKATLTLTHFNFSDIFTENKKVRVSSYEPGNRAGSVTVRIFWSLHMGNFIPVTEILVFLDCRISETEPAQLVTSFFCLFKLIGSVIRVCRFISIWYWGLKLSLVVVMTKCIRFFIEINYFDQQFNELKTCLLGNNKVKSLSLLLFVEYLFYFLDDFMFRSSCTRKN